MLEMENKKVSMNIPEELLLTAKKFTGMNQTEVVIYALNELIRLKKRQAFLALRGKIQFDLDIDKIRGRKP